MDGSGLDGGGLDGAWAEELARAAHYRLQRIHHQRRAVDRLRRELPLPTIELPFLFTTALGRADLDTLADALLAGAGVLAGR